MNAKETGGPAFPVHPEIRDNEPHAGMTLRDWFAGQIAAAAIVNATGIPPGTETSKGAFGVVSQAAYELADAMIAERSK